MKKKYSLKHILIDYVIQDHLLISLISGAPLGSKVQPILRFLSEVIIIFICILTAIISHHNHLGLIEIVSLILTIHTIYWFLLGHGLHIFSYIFSLKVDIIKKILFINSMMSRFKNKKITSILYGGITRGDFDHYSDIDVFVIAINKSLSSKIMIFLNTIIAEKLRAFMNGIPLDIDNIEYLIFRINIAKKERYFLILTSEEKTSELFSRHNIPYRIYKPKPIIKDKMVR